jgi:hypothetical protein
MDDQPNTAELGKPRDVKWWRRKPSRGEIVATVCLAVIVAAVVWAVLNIGSVIGDRNLLRR